MTTEKEYTQNAKMRPRARLISLLGDELISDERVAVVELVKNSYDADAETVTIRFETDETHAPIRLIISDDGHGMGLETVLGSWFEPGTIAKKHTDRSPKKNRLYQGAKGVGRFAAARLGDALLLETKRSQDSKGTTVLLEWGEFDDESYLDEVEITYETTDALSFDHGTILTIEGLHKKKEWGEDDFKNLHDRLSRLISPFNEVKDFSINLEIPYHPELTGEVEPHPLTKNPKYTFKGVLSKDGSLDAHLEVDKKRHKSYSKHPLAMKDESVQCGAFEFEIRAWDRDRTGLSPYMLKYDMNISEVRRKLDTYCGVSIYRDGFRVHPYGEQGNDWLSLDTRSRQNPTMHLANNQVIASIKTSRETNPELKDRTTREGLVHNHEYEQLKNWFLRVISTLEEERYRLRPREDAKPEYTTTLFEAFDLSDVVTQTHRQLGKKHPVSKLVRDKDQDIRDGVKKLQEHYSRVLLAAGLGQLVDLVIHEIGAPLGRISREVGHLKNLIDKYDFGESDNSNITTSFENVSSWIEQIASLRARLDPKTAGRRGRATSFDVADEILGNLNLFENLIDKQKIQIQLDSPEQAIIVHMARSNLGQIVANLLDNSVYWLTRHHGDGKGGKIHILLTPVEHGFKMLFSDDGPGISEQDRERAFEQYFTTKPNGMGLGLYIARQVIEPYGKLIYRDDCELPGACFEASFTQRVGL